MCKLFLMLLLISLPLFTQTFVVEKVTGKVSVQKGMEEKWTVVKKGEKLSDNDLLSTGKNSMVKLSGNENIFLLKSNSALNLAGIRKMSVNDLLLALTKEEIKNIPKHKEDSKIKSTAVYGTEYNGKTDNQVIPSDLGKRKINGAMQLAEAGFKESSVLVAMETFRKYPETQQMVSNRIYFADLLKKLSLYEEAYSEFSKINSMNLHKSDKDYVESKLVSLQEKLK